MFAVQDSPPSTYIERYTLDMAMRFRQAILVAIAALLVSANTPAAAETKPDLPQSPQSAYALRTGRSLRFDDGVDADNDEERAWGDFSSLKSNVRKIFSRKGGKVQLPAPRHISEEALKKDLELSGKAIRSHGGLKGSKVRDGIGKLDGWVGKDVTSFDAWMRLGLGKVREDKLEKAMDTEKFAEYLTYVKMFDDAAVAKWRLTGKPPLAHPEPTAAELTARAIALAINKREDKYAKLALGLDALTENALKQQTNYRFYEYFKEAL